MRSTCEGGEILGLGASGVSRNGGYSTESVLVLHKCMHLLSQASAAILSVTLTLIHMLTQEPPVEEAPKEPPPLPQPSPPPRSASPAVGRSGAWTTSHWAGEARAKQRIRFEMRLLHAAGAAAVS